MLEISPPSLHDISICSYKKEFNMTLVEPSIDIPQVFTDSQHIDSQEFHSSNFIKALLGIKQQSLT
jgi:hypothetical protein